MALLPAVVLLFQSLHPAAARLERRCLLSVRQSSVAAARKPEIGAMNSVLCALHVNIVRSSYVCHHGFPASQRFLKLGTDMFESCVQAPSMLQTRYCQYPP